MNLYLVKPRDVDSDYADELINAHGHRREGPDGPLYLSRTGPFVPPFYDCGGTLIVSESYRHRLSEAGAPPVDFKRVLYFNVYDIPWEQWDWEVGRDLPPVVPDSGEPDDYFLENDPCPELMAQMEPSWELILPVIPCDINWMGIGKKTALGNEFTVRSMGHEYNGLFYDSDKLIYAIVDEPTKQWLEGVFGEWVSFIYLEPVE